jgi:hypothetical protein
MRNSLTVLSEPSVLAKAAEETDCKQALLSGPYAASREGPSNKISLGIIGTYNLVELMERWLDQCNTAIASRPHKEANDARAERRHKLLFPDFDGCPVLFEKTLTIEPQFRERIPLSEIANLDKANKFGYIEDLIGILESRMAKVCEAADRKPDVILVLLTDEMYEACHVVGDYHRRLRRVEPADDSQLDLFKDFDQFSAVPKGEGKLLYRVLRSALKKIAMNPKYGVPIQIVRERTLLEKETQNLATRSWNLCTGLYYKTGDLPWIMSRLDTKACFLGVSFFHKKTRYSDQVYTSMAHLFSNQFDSIVLRGDRVAFDEVLRAPVLDRAKARALVERALSEYRSVRDTFPERLVIHKTSRYSDEELLGIRDILDDLKIAYDLVSITKGNLRLVRWGEYPVPRGTMWDLQTEAYLYTKGFVPDLQTYPGSHLPAPFLVQKARGDSSMQAICNEILALTKLNWNTADFCCGVPITLGSARSVGEIFKEFGDEEEYEPSRLFRFYM